MNATNTQPRGEEAVPQIRDRTAAGAKGRGATAALDATWRQVRASPFAAIAGAAAVSAGLALLLPASKREAEVMGDVADKLGEVARGAADSAMEAGRAQAETLAQAALASVGSAVIDNVVAGSEGGRSDTARAGG